MRETATVMLVAIAMAALLQHVSAFIAPAAPLKVSHSTARSSLTRPSMSHAVVEVANSGLLIAQLAGKLLFGCNELQREHFDCRICVVTDCLCAGDGVPLALRLWRPAWRWLQDHGRRGGGRRRGRGRQRRQRGGCLQRHACAVFRVREW
jgi:hypothetical protein